jgi:hypothetical protein
MEWIVKIEDEKNQRIRFEFVPLEEELRVYGEYNIGGNRWKVFSEAEKKFVSEFEGQKNHHKIQLNDLQKMMECVVIDMRPRIEEYENLNKGFTVLKEVAFKEED